MERIPYLLFRQLRGEIGVRESHQLRVWVRASKKHRAFYEQFASAESLQAQIREFYAVRKRIWEKITLNYHYSSLIFL